VLTLLHIYSTNPSVVLGETLHPMPVARYGVIYLHLHLKSPFSVMKINEATCSEAAAKCHLKEAMEKPKMPRKNSSDRMLLKGSKLAG